MNSVLEFQRLMRFAAMTFVLSGVVVHESRAEELQGYMKVATKLLYVSDMPGAIATLEAGLKSDPKNSDAYFMLGEAYGSLGHKDLSARNYKLAYKFDHDPSAPSSRYEVKDDTVYDKTTNLTWQRCSVGQKWTSGKGCLGVVQQMSFEDAQAQATGLWRVPTKIELSSLLDKKRVGAELPLKIDEIAFPGLDENQLWYWTSTPESETFAWSVGFGEDNQYHGYNYRSFRFGLRLVKSGQ
jgi:hypothetical protein